MVIELAGMNIGPTFRPFIIAEMSGNHNQSLETALSIVDAAAAAGAHAIKLQTFTPDTITIQKSGGSFQIDDKDSLWNGNTLYSLYQKAYTPWDWHRAIFERAKMKNIICFSSPFSESAVDFLEGLNAPAYKIASFENNHIPLIKKAAATGKPLIISTGMASLSELELAVKSARDAGCTNLILLKCTSTYPSDPINSNILTIPHLKSMFNCEVGISDHTMGVGVPVASVALGATVIEKHFTLSRAAGGVDSAFSLEPQELSSLVLETERAWQALGSVQYGPTSSEQKSVAFRRSIYVVEDINPGQVFTTDNLRVVRPGDGAPPHLYEVLLGRTARKNYVAGSPLSFDDLL